MKMTSKWRWPQNEDKLKKKKKKDLNDYLLSYQTKPTKQFLPNQTYQTIPTKPNLQKQIYQAKPTRPNLPNLTV